MLLLIGRKGRGGGERWGFEDWLAVCKQSIIIIIIMSVGGGKGRGESDEIFFDSVTNLTSAGGKKVYDDDIPFVLKWGGLWDLVDHELTEVRK